MVKALVFPAVVYFCCYFFARAGWTTKNYLGENTPYSLGTAIIIIIISYSYLFKDTFFLVYLTILYLTGFVDDRYGTKYPKGLRGHINHLIKNKQVSTGLLKLVSTLVVAVVYLLLRRPLFLEGAASFLLLICAPHVLNLFDTKPLRAWKVVFLHGLFFLPLFMQQKPSFLFSILAIIAVLVYFEAARKGMLGDNGATLLGGIIAVLFVQQASLLIQLLVVCLYLLVIAITEKLSLSRLIERNSILRFIDRFGVSYK